MLSFDATEVRWRSSRQHSVFKFKHPGRNIDQFLLSADGSRLAIQFLPVESVVRSRQAVAEGQASIQVWITSTGEFVQTLPMIPLRFPFCKILWDPAGARVLRSSLSNNSDDNRSQMRQRFVLVDVASDKELWEREFLDLVTF